ncbi:response regulator transcription factor [Helcococcus kunzii]|uniref:LytR/AlgR family response regulator transcription factor n=1 Tax=Helcococcus kunzii TaxID=40091 RepID=UPI001BB01CB0|nr:LytTR family DNA-binding domain-containing protein [Helcococcus kunzii]QUY64124.1 response regulator transcription factor [Helcococcus kunzii]
MSGIVRIAIIDDDRNIRDVYESYVLEWARVSKRGSLLVEVEKYISAESFLFDYEEDNNFDIILLDIEMGEMNGVELSKRIRVRDSNVQIVFISGYSEDIGYGYEVEALNFLVKPIDKHKLFEVLDRSLEKQEILDKYIVIKSEAASVKFFFKNIFYILSDKNYLDIYYDNKVYRTRMTLKEMEALLDERFHKLDRSTIINIEKIDRLTRGDLTLNNGITLSIPKGKFDVINRKFIEYF